MLRGQGEPVGLEAASNKEEVAFQVGFAPHSKEVVLGRLEQNWQWEDDSKTNHVKGMVLEAQMLLLKGTCGRVYCHS